MARVYTRSLAVGVTDGDTYTDVYTVPPETTVILRDVLLVDLGGVAVYRSLVLHRGGGFIMLLRFPPPGNQGHDHWAGRQALLPGDVLRVGDGGQEVAYALTGYVFDGA